MSLKRVAQAARIRMPLQDQASRTARPEEKERPSEILRRNSKVRNQGLGKYQYEPR
jgi:hypothetical protein